MNMRLIADEFEIGAQLEREEEGITLEDLPGQEDELGEREIIEEQTD